MNSVYFGLTTPVNSIEEAVFYLGVRQIRQLAMVTPVIEDFQRLTRQCTFPWREFWQHCIGTAILTREVTANVPGPTEDSDYVAGLVHDIGKIVMAWSFPDHFAEIHRQAIAGERAISEIEDEVLGVNHSELGALYLERHRLPELMIYSARYHHCPEKSPQFRHTIAAVQLSDLLLRSSKIGCSGDYVEVTREACYAAPVWQVLLARTPEAEQAIVKASLSRTLEQIPHDARRHGLKIRNPRNQELILSPGFLASSFNKPAPAPPPPAPTSPPPQTAGWPSAKTSAL